MCMIVRDASVRVVGNCPVASCSAAATVSGLVAPGLAAPTPPPPALSTKYEGRSNLPTHSPPPPPSRFLNVGDLYSPGTSRNNN